jgi:superfamily II DNA or RNA helicase
MILVEKTDNPNYLRVTAEKTVFNFLQLHFTVKDKKAFWSPLYRAKKWDGKIRFLRSDGTILSGLLVEILRIAKINHWAVQFEKELVLNQFKFERNEIELSLKGETLYPDQIEALEKILKYNYGLAKLPTSQGKSYIEVAMLNLFRLKGLKNMILIVPRQSLVEQIFEDLVLKSPFIKPEECGRLYGERKEWDRPVIVATWQSLTTLLQLDKTYGKRFELLIQDEVHVASASAKVVHEVITSFAAKYKYGFSATVISRDSDKLEYFNSVSLFGPITASNTIKKLQADKRISDAEIRVKLLSYPIQPEIKTYKEYEDFIRYNPKRREYIVELVKEARLRMPKSNGLILIRNVDFAKEMTDMLREIFGDSVHLIEGSIKIDDRIDIKNTIKENENQILVATTGTFGMGENIKNLHWLILLQARKSEVEAIQQVGRLLRVFPGKTKAVIYDITDNLIVVREVEEEDEHGIKTIKTVRKNFGKRHLKKRIDVFQTYGLEVVGIEKVFLT